VSHVEPHEGRTPFGWPTDGQRSWFDTEDFKLVDGWWTFSGVMGDTSQFEAAEIPAKQAESRRQTRSVLVKVLSRSQKWPLSRTFRADARTRTGDPFITRERQVGDARPLAGTRGHVFPGTEAVSTFY
jgi:hypothetical protein